MRSGRTNAASSVRLGLTGPLSNRTVDRIVTLSPPRRRIGPSAGLRSEEARWFEAHGLNDGMENVILFEGRYQYGRPFACSGTLGPAISASSTKSGRDDPPINEKGRRIAPAAFPVD